MLYFGDSLLDDVVNPRMAGWRTIAIVPELSVIARAVSFFDSTERLAIRSGRSALASKGGSSSDSVSRRDSSSSKSNSSNVKRRRSSAKGKRLNEISKSRYSSRNVMVKAKSSFGSVISFGRQENNASDDIIGNHPLLSENGSTSLFAATIIDNAELCVPNVLTFLPPRWPKIMRSMSDSGLGDN